MECPKCHSQIDDNQTVCPVCKKVLLLECPNCHALGTTPICEECGYTILTKCSKCSKIIPTDSKTCPKCGFTTSISLANNECEIDDFASLIVEFGALKTIKKNLKSAELYQKFFYKLKNLFLTQTKGIDCKIIKYNNSYAINLNKELSFGTSCDKAIRLALKIINSFAELNKNLSEEFACNLKLSITIIKKSSEKLQEYTVYNNNCKMLDTGKKAKYLKGLTLILDQYVHDEIYKNYKTDSLYTVENNGKTCVFYEVLLDSYILPPKNEKYDTPVETQFNNIKKQNNKEEKDKLYSFKIFDINAKCKFENVTIKELFEKFDNFDLKNNGQIFSINSEKEFPINTSKFINIFKKHELKVLHLTCSERLNYAPWGILESLFWENLNYSLLTNPKEIENLNPEYIRLYKPLFELKFMEIQNSISYEDSRFLFIDLFCKFLSSLKNTVIILDNIEFLDDTTLQVLELYFSKYKNFKQNFVFIAQNNTESLHTKIKSLLRTSKYTEFKLKDSPIDTLISNINVDAKEFLESFYFEKIKENFNGSNLYFENALKYLMESNVLVNFNNKLIIKNNKSVILPNTIEGLYKERLKHLGSENLSLSFILAYSIFLGEKLDFKTLELLEIEDLKNAAQKLENSGLARIDNGYLYINNFSILYNVISDSLKQNIKEFLAKNILAKLGNFIDDSIKITVLGILNAFKEEYLILWRNSIFAINSGDYDAYLKNSFGFLSLLGIPELDISKEEQEENKKNVYNNILMSLYNYSPTKIYHIEKILLADAFNAHNNEQIVKLSNLMLQGALLTSNYTEAQGLMHNILSKMKNATLIVDGEINKKFLLLSLINIQILYNLGNYTDCVLTANETLSVINIDNLASILPAGFTQDAFIKYLLETYRLAAFAKLHLLQDDIEEFFANIEQALNVNFAEKTCIIAIKDFLADKTYAMEDIEKASAFSKIVYLILQEFNNLQEDYNTFAQNIYQAKLLAIDINEKEVELFCDLLIAYAYFKSDYIEKANSIYRDVLEFAQHSSILSITILAKFFIAELEKHFSPSDALVTINDALNLLKHKNCESKILFAILLKLYIQIMHDNNANFDLESDEQKLYALQDKLSSLI